MDVELAVDLVALGIEDAYDVAVLASADTVALALVINDVLPHRVPPGRERSR